MPDNLIEKTQGEIQIPIIIFGTNPTNEQLIQAKEKVSSFFEQIANTDLSMYTSAWIQRLFNEAKATRQDLQTDVAQNEPQYEDTPNYYFNHTVSHILGSLHLFYLPEIADQSEEYIKLQNAIFEFKKAILKEVVNFKYAPPESLNSLSVQTLIEHYIQWVRGFHNNSFKNEKYSDKSYIDIFLLYFFEPMKTLSPQQLTELKSLI